MRKYNKVDEVIPAIRGRTKILDVTGCSMFVLNRYVNGFNEHVSPRTEANTQLLDVDIQIDSKFEVSNTQKLDNKTKDLRHGLGTTLDHSGIHSHHHISATTLSQSIQSLMLA